MSIACALAVRDRLPTSSSTMDTLDTAAPKIDLQHEQDFASVVQSPTFLSVLIGLAALLFTLGTVPGVRAVTLCIPWQFRHLTMHFHRTVTHLPVQGKGKCYASVGPIGLRQNHLVSPNERWRNSQWNSSIDAREFRHICIVDRACKMIYQPGPAANRQVQQACILVSRRMRSNQYNLWMCLAIQKCGAGLKGT